MLFLRSLFTTVSTSVVVVILAALAASPAHASVQMRQITISGSFHLQDDDVTAWCLPYNPACLPKASSSFTKTILVPVYGASATQAWSACAGGEVRGRADFVFYSFSSAVAVNHNLYMFEGSSCNSTDLDGQDAESITVVNDWGGGGSTRATDAADGYLDFVEFSFYLTTKLVWV